MILKDIINNKHFNQTKFSLKFINLNIWYCFLVLDTFELVNSEDSKKKKYDEYDDLEIQ